MHEKCRPNFVTHNKYNLDWINTFYKLTQPKLGYYPEEGAKNAS